MKQNFKFTRLLEQHVQKFLGIFGGVVITGPRFVGKTTLASHFAKTTLLLTKMHDLLLAQTNLTDFLSSNKKPILIDEWQVLTTTYLEIKSFIDQQMESGVVILTGSVNPILRFKITDPAAGRFKKVCLNSLTLFETGESEQLVSLHELVENNLFAPKVLKNPVSLEKIIYFVCRGGLPLSVLNDDFRYVNEQYFSDVIDFAANKNNFPMQIRTIRKMAEFCALNVSSQVNWMKFNDNFLENKLSNPTIYKYRDILELELMLIDSLPSYSSNISSKKRLVEKPKTYFFDSAIAVACAGLSPEALLNNLNTLGMYFENFVYHELKVYADYLEARLFYYRDQNGNEVDFIMEFPGGAVAAIEVKLGVNLELAIDLACKSLIRYKQTCSREREVNSHWNPNRNWIPNKLIVIVGLCDSVFKKTVDGEDVYVVPITALKP